MKVPMEIAMPVLDADGKIHAVLPSDEAAEFAAFMVERNAKRLNLALQEHGRCLCCRKLFRAAETHWWQAGTCLVERHASMSER